MPAKPTAPPITIETVDPSGDLEGVIVLYGQPKIGKSTLASSLVELSLDTENGLKRLRGAKRIVVNNNVEMRQAVAHCKGIGIKRIAIDTIDKVYDWASKFVCQKYQVKALGEIEWGAGWQQAEDLLLEFVSTMRGSFDLVVLVAHQRNATFGEHIKSARQVDLPGKLSRKFAAEVDQLGFCEIDREEDGEQHRFVNFNAYQEVDSGGRIEALENRRIEFFKDRAQNAAIFEKIFNDAKEGVIPDGQEAEDTSPEKSLHSAEAADSSSDSETGEGSADDHG
jgi:hypothetical protein